jgi:predicted permease
VANTLAVDILQALRSLRRAPGLALTVGLVLALGIGACTTVFSIVNAYLLRSMPYPQSERLYGVSDVLPVDHMEARAVFEIPITWDLDVLTLVDPDVTPELVNTSWVSPGYLEAFGLRPVIGRGFLPGEYEPGERSVMVIGHDLWQERYGRDPDIVGRRVSVFSSDRPDDVEDFTIIGVLPEHVWFHNRYVEVLVPLRSDQSVYMGRLREDLDPDRAAAILLDLARPRMEEVPADFRLEPFQERYTRRIRPTLTFLGLSVLLVLLIACVNGAVLLIVRTAARDRELSIRRFLGAGRGRIIRQLSVEGLMLALAAGAVGTAAAHLALDGLAGPIQEHLGQGVPGGSEMLTMDGRVLLAAAVTTLLTGMLFSVVPLVTVAWRRLSRQLSAAGRHSTEGRHVVRLRSVLVAAEVAFSVVLLVAARRTARRRGTHGPLGAERAAVRPGVLTRPGGELRPAHAPTQPSRPRGSGGDLPQHQERDRRPAVCRSGHAEHPYAVRLADERLAG